MNKFLALLGFDAATMTVRKEGIGGITTFLTMGYSWQFALTEECWHRGRF